MKHAADIIEEPIISEKANRLQSEESTYIFKINKDATKVDVKKAVEDEFNVKVDKVNIAKLPPKSRRTPQGAEGQKPGYKKAFVSLSEGEINLF